MDQTHLVSLLIASYLLPLGFLTMAWMANRRSPWLASIGAFLSLMGFLPVALYAGQDSLYYDIAQLGSNPQFVTLAQYWNGDPIMSFYGAAFGLGSTIGPAFIGLALWRSGTVPRRAAALLIASRLSALAFPVVPYNVAVDIVLAGVVLFLVSSIPISLAVLRMPSGMNEEL